MNKPQIAQPSYLDLSTLAAVPAFMFYPMTLAPLGPYTNGGALGLTSILLALALTWTAFGLNRSHPQTRMLIQLPMTALITYMAIHESVIQYMLGPGKWFWF